MPWCCPFASSSIATSLPVVDTYKKREERFLQGLADGLRLAGLFAYEELLKKQNFWGSKIV
ncbi:MAG: hypothetical protein ACI819_001012 [Neolewinella sp.]|jgi:hypothetical protein